MIVLRCVGGLAFGLLLASCATRVDTSKYALPQGDASSSTVRFSRADINPDGTLVNAHPIGSRRGSGKKYPSEEIDRKQSDSKPTLAFQQNSTGATSNIGAPTIRTGLSSRQSDEPATTGTLSARSNPHLETPQIGSERWEKEEAENQKLDKQLNVRMKGICTGC